MTTPNRAGKSPAMITDKVPLMPNGHAGFEQSVLTSQFKQILAGQDKLKNNFNTFKADITKAVEFQNLEIEDLQKESQKQCASSTKVETKVDNAFERVHANRQHIDKTIFRDKLARATNLQE